MASALAIGVTAWTPLASGWLTGKYAQREPGRAPSQAGRLDDAIASRFDHLRDDRAVSVVAQMIEVADQERSLKFYADVLGFEVRTDVLMGPMGPTGRWIEVAPPGAQTTLVLSDAAAFGKQDQIGSSADITFRSDDVFALHKSLTASGADVSEPEKQDWGTFVHVTDPTGTRSSSAARSGCPAAGGHNGAESWQSP
jgi:lactoylglutathione lyase